MPALLHAHETVAPPAAPARSSGDDSAHRDDTARTDTTARAGAVSVALLSLGALLGTVVPLPVPVRTTAVVAFWLVAPGLLACRAGALPSVVRAAAVPALGLTALVAVSTTTLWTGAWAPVPWTVVVAAACLLVASPGAWRAARALPGRRWALLDARGPADRSDRTARVRAGTQWGLVAVGLTSGLAVVPALHDAVPTRYGLLAAAPPVYPAAIVVVVVAFALAVRDAARAAPRARRALVRATAALGAVVVLLRAVPALASDVPVYPWTYKHVGVTDAVAGLGTLVPDADIYHSWPAFFAATAWVAESSGASSVSLAHAITPLVHVLLALGVAALAHACGLRGPQVLVAAFVAEVVSWVGQDYFAPQSLALVLAVVVLALALQPRERRGAAWLALACFAALVPLHQLTPFWVLGVLAVLAFLGRVRGVVFWGALAVAVPYVVAHWEIVEAYGVLSSASPLDNTRTNAPAPQSAERAVGQVVFQATALALWVPAAATRAVRAVRRRGAVLVPGVVAFSPFALLAAQSYGGEAVLRVFLFSTAGMAVIVAPWVTRLLAAGLADGRARRARAVAGFGTALALLLAWTGLAAQSYLTAWFPHRVTAAQVEVTRTLLDDVPGQVFLSPAGGGWPIRASAGYVPRVLESWDVDLPLLATVDQDALAAARAATTAEADRGAAVLALLDAALEARPAPTYALFAANTYTTADYEDPGFSRELRALHDALRASPDWETVWVTGDVEVLRYVPASAEGTPAAVWQPPAG